MHEKMVTVVDVYHVIREAQKWTRENTCKKGTATISGVSFPYCTTHEAFFNESNFCTRFPTSAVDSGIGILYKLAELGE